MSGKSLGKPYYFLNSFLSPTLPYFNDAWCWQNGEMGDFEETYKISFYYLDWRVADHPPAEGALTTFATHRSPSIIHLIRYSQRD